MFFKNREVTVKVNKVKKETDDPKETLFDEINFERKTDHVLSRMEEIGAKMFLGVCAYIILDTFRQVQIEKAKKSTS